MSLSFGFLPPVRYGATDAEVRPQDNGRLGVASNGLGSSRVPASETSSNALGHIQAVESYTDGAQRVRAVTGQSESRRWVMLIGVLVVLLVLETGIVLATL